MEVASYDRIDRTPRANGVAVVALESGLNPFDFATGALGLVAHPEADAPGVRLNGGKVDPYRRLVVGSLDMAVFDTPGHTARGALYRLDADLRLTRMASGIGVLNGPCWSADSRRFHYAASARGKIYARDWQEGGHSASVRTVFARTGARDPRWQYGRGRRLPLDRGQPRIL